MLTSVICRYDHLNSPWYRYWATALGYGNVTSSTPCSHRKIWEFCAIAQALYERDMLRNGRRGCGFAVGKEPLASMFAAHGATVLGTDLALENTDERWENTDQHAAARSDLFRPEIIGSGAFDQRVRFRSADMTKLQTLQDEGGFDFIWSSCAFEHLGTLDAGIDFVLKSTELLKPFGIAVHTTEYNVSSNDDTIECGPDVLYRKQDFELLGYQLRKLGCALLPFDYEPGYHVHDISYDYPPFFMNGRMHLKIRLGDHIATSALLIIQKGAS